MPIRNNKINYFNSTSVAEKTKDIKSEKEPLCSAGRRLTGNLERGISEFGDNRSQIAGHLEWNSSEEAQLVGAAHTVKKFGKERTQDHSFGGNRSNWFQGRWKGSHGGEERTEVPRTVQNT